MEQKLTDEQKLDIEQRAKAFGEEYMELTKKHEVEMVGQPHYSHLGQGIYATLCNLVIYDKKYAPKPEPVPPAAPVEKKPEENLG